MVVSCHSQENSMSITFVKDIDAVKFHQIIFHAATKISHPDTGPNLFYYNTVACERILLYSKTP